MVADLRKRLSPRDIVIEVWDAERQGSAVCALRAFQTGLEAFQDKPFTVLQDDALPCWNFSGYADQFMPDVAAGTIINWYAHPWVTSDTARARAEDYLPRFINAPGRSFIVSLAVSWPRLWAERVEARLRDAVDHDPRDDQGRRHGDDAYIAQVLHYFRGEYWTHSPSLVQHRGEFSVVANRQVNLASHDARLSRCFVGAQFDATAFNDRVDIHWRRIKGDTMTKHVKEHGEHKKHDDEPTLNSEGRQLAVEHAQDVPPAPTAEHPKMPQFGPDVGNEFGVPPTRFADPFRVGNQCNECGDRTGECLHMLEKS